MTPDTDFRKMAEEMVNPFIRKWCECVGHLLDTDENDGESLRNSIEDALRSVSEKHEKIGFNQAVEECLKICSHRLSAEEYDAIRRLRKDVGNG